MKPLLCKLYANSDWPWWPSWDNGQGLTQPTFTQQPLFGLIFDKIVYKYREVYD